MTAWCKANKSLKHNFNLKLRCGKIKWTVLRTKMKKNLRNYRINMTKIKRNQILFILKRYLKRFLNWMFKHKEKPRRSRPLRK